MSLPKGWGSIIFAHVNLFRDERAFYNVSLITTAVRVAIVTYTGKFHLSIICLCVCDVSLMTYFNPPHAKISACAYFLVAECARCTSPIWFYADARFALDAIGRFCAESCDSDCWIRSWRYTFVFVTTGSFNFTVFEWLHFLISNSTVPDFWRNKCTSTGRPSKHCCF